MNALLFQVAVTVPMTLGSIVAMRAIDGIFPEYGAPIVIGLLSASCGGLAVLLRDALRTSRRHDDRAARLALQVIDLENDIDSRDERFAQ